MIHSFSYFFLYGLHRVAKSKQKIWENCCESAAVHLQEQEQELQAFRVRLGQELMFLFPFFFFFFLLWRLLKRCCKQYAMGN